MIICFQGSCAALDVGIYDLMDSRTPVRLRSCIWNQSVICYPQRWNKVQLYPSALHILEIGSAERVMGVTQVLALLAH